MSVQYVRDFYGVPASRGRRVTLDGVPGRITGASSQLRIKFDKDKHTSIVHPTDAGLIYFGADGKQIWPKKQESVAMTTDNRTNEPGRCWCDHREMNHYSGESCRVFGCTCPRFALVAAQGAAPQAEIHEPSHDRVYCVRCGGNWPCQPAPVLPSSGVDEAALAGVIELSVIDGLLISISESGAYRVDTPVKLLAEVAARAVAAWLKEGAK